MQANLIPHRPSVKPIQLPWTISTSVSNLSLSFGEGRDCIVQCDAFFGHHAESQFQRVEIVFERAICCRMLTYHSDYEIPYAEEYDWGNILDRPKTHAELRAWLMARAQRWGATGDCTDPNFYSVEQSPWASEYRDLFRHFLLLGTDNYVEVLALGIRWSSIRSLDQSA